MKYITILVLFILSLAVMADFFPEEKKVEKSKIDLLYEQHLKNLQDRIKNSKTISEACVTNLKKYQDLAKKYSDIPSEKRNALQNLKFDHLKNEISSLEEYCLGEPETPTDTQIEEEKDET